MNYSRSVKWTRISVVFAAILFIQSNYGLINLLILLITLSLQIWTLMFYRDYKEALKWMKCGPDLMKPLNQSIGASGCLLTSFTMNYNYLKGTSYNPRQMNSLLGNNACTFQWYNNLGLQVEYLQRIGLADIYRIAVANIKDYNRPIIVGMQGPVNTHFVLVRSYTIDANGEVILYIYDSANSRNYTSLNQYINAGYSFGSLYTGVYK